MAPMHVLVVDDEPTAAQAVARVLEHAGARVSTAGNGRQALDVLADKAATDHPITLIVLDIMMPEMTGLELLDELEARSIDIPTLTITGTSDVPTLNALRDKGHGDFLEKPFNADDLLDRISRLLGGG